MKCPFRQFTGGSEEMEAVAIEEIMKATAKPMEQERKIFYPEQHNKHLKDALQEAKI